MLHYIVLGMWPSTLFKVSLSRFSTNCFQFLLNHFISFYQNTTWYCSSFVWVLFSALYSSCTACGTLASTGIWYVPVTSVLIFSLLPFPPWICPPLICLICYLCFILLYISLCNKIIILSEGFTMLSAMHSLPGFCSIRFFPFLLPFRQTIAIKNPSGKAGNTLMIDLILHGYWWSTSVLYHSHPSWMLKSREHMDPLVVMAFLCGSECSGHFGDRPSQKTNANTVCFETLFQGCIQYRAHPSSYFRCS